MTFFLLACIYLLTASCGYASDSDKLHSGTFWNHPIREGERSRRTMSVLRFAARAGQRALQTVLKGSTEVPGDTRIFNQFVKRGNYQKALADFQSIRPVNVKETVSDGVRIRVGEVGDRLVFLSNRDTGRETVLELITKDIPEINEVPSIYSITYID